MSWFNWAYHGRYCKKCKQAITVYPCCYCGFKPELIKEN